MDDNDHGESRRSPPPSLAGLAHHLRQNWNVLLGGQILSLLLAGSGAAQATLHLDCGLSAPTFTLTLIYFGLSFHLVYQMMTTKQHIQLQQQYSHSSLILMDDRSKRRARSSKRGRKHQRRPLETIHQQHYTDVDHHDQRNDEESDDIQTNGNDNDSLSPSRLETNGVGENDDDEGIDNSGEIDVDHDDDGAGPVSTDFEDEFDGENDNGLQQATTPYSFFFGRIKLHRPVWWYIILAFFDVESNAITMLAFRYTTLTSVTLFDALAIPSAMIVSRCWLQRKYDGMHYLGVIVCMTGVVMNVLQDYKSDVSGGNGSNGMNDTEDGATSHIDDEAYPHKLWGDVCAIIGGLLYGINDTLTEITVHNNAGTTEYLGMMGFFAFIISLTQSLLFEWDEILEFFGQDASHSATCSLRMGWMIYMTFVGVTILSYMCASQFLLISEAAFYNLSLLTGDFWSLIFSVFAERIVPAPMFFVALVLVLSGVVIYEMTPSPTLPSHDVGDPEDEDYASNQTHPDLQTDDHVSSGDERWNEKEGHEIGIEMNETKCF